MFLKHTKTGDGVGEIRWKSTDINLASLENVPVDLVAVEIDQSPVPGEVLGAVVDGNDRGVDGVTNHALVRSRPLLGDLAMDLVYVLDHLPRLLHQVLVVLARASPLGRLVLDDRTQPLNLVSCLDGEELVADSAHTIDGICVGIDTKDDDLLASLAAVFARWEPVTICGRRASDVDGGEKEDAVALVALSEVDGTRALVVRCLERSDLDAKRGNEGATKLGDGADRGVEGEKLWVNRRGDDRLAACNLDVGEPLSSQNIYAALGCLLGNLEGESPGHHPYPEIERTDDLLS